MNRIKEIAKAILEKERDGSLSPETIEKLKEMA